MALHELGVATLVSARMLNKCVEIAAMDSTVPADVARSSAMG